MPIQQELVPDFGSQIICDFLTSYHVPSYIDPIDEDYWFTNRAYAFRGSREIHTQPFELLSWQATIFELRSKRSGRFIRMAKIWDAVTHPFHLDIVATLLLKSNLDKPKADRIELEFSNFDLSVGDLPALETQLIQSGVAADDYQILLRLALRRNGNAQISRINADAYLSQVSALYELTELERGEFSCDRPSTEIPEDYVLIGDVEKPDDAILQSEEGRPECEDIDFVYSRLGTAFQYEEVRISWEMREVRVGRCRLMKTYIPVYEHRICKHALYGYVISEEDVIRYIKDRLRLCIIEGAIIAAVVAIVLEFGIEAAVASFESVVVTCIESIVTRDVACLFAKLGWVLERGDWT